MVSPPFERPALPIPATARPMIIIVEDWAAPHTADPASKIAMNDRNVYFVEISTLEDSRSLLRFLTLRLK